MAENNTPNTHPVDLKRRVTEGTATVDQAIEWLLHTRRTPAYTAALDLVVAERDRLRAALWEASSIVAGIAVDHPRLGGVKSIELCDSVREPLGGWHPDHDS